MIYELSANTVAVVTGASSGIGRATALALAEKGLRLALLARSESGLSEVADEAGGRGASARIVYRRRDQIRRIGKR